MKTFWKHFSLLRLLFKGQPHLLTVLVVVVVVGLFPESYILGISYILVWCSGPAMCISTRRWIVYRSNRALCLDRSSYTLSSQGVLCRVLKIAEAAIITCDNVKSLFCLFLPCWHLFQGGLVTKTNQEGGRNWEQQAQPSDDRSAPGNELHVRMTSVVTSSLAVHTHCFFFF